MTDAVERLELRPARSANRRVSTVVGLQRAGLAMVIGVALWLVCLAITAVVSITRGAFFAVDWAGGRLVSLGGDGGGGIAFDALWPTLALVVVATYLGVRAGLDDHERRQRT